MGSKCLITTQILQVKHSLLTHHKMHKFSAYTIVRGWNPIISTFYVQTHCVFMHS